MSNPTDNIPEAAGAEPYVQRRGRAEFSQRTTADRLPPHAPAAEQGVLGCILVAADTARACLKEAQEYFQGKQPFFDLKHAAVFAAAESLAREDGVIDMITLPQRLKERGELEGVGGSAGLSAWADSVPSAANLKYYLEIVWEKFIAREILRTGVEAGARVYTETVSLEPILDQMEKRVAEIRAAAARHGNAMPANLKTLADFEEQYFDMWFGAQANEPGHELPFEFPFKVRRGEQTFFIAEKGAGKSTLMSYIRLHMVSKGEKACIASLETKTPMTLKLMAAQLLGMKRLPDNQWGHQQAIAAYEWLREKVVVYDFLGIADWRDILHCFDYAQAHLGCTMFEIDSVMRMGIMEDDIAQQGFAAATFAQFAQGRNVILWIINHLNKSDKSVKHRSRGSHQWIDNSHNVVSVHMNPDKQAILDELKQQLDAGEIDRARYDEKVAAKRDKFDSYFDLHNQRWPGSRQNGRIYLYFNPDSLQLHKGPFEESVNWLGVWEKRDK